MSTVLYIEDDLESLFTAIFDAYTYKDVIAITSSTAYQPDFNTVIKRVYPDIDKAQRIERAIKKYGGDYTYKYLARLIRSNDEFKHTAILNYVRLLFSEKRPVYKMLNKPEVLIFNELSSKIGNEAHRILGFLRFMETKSGVYYAHYEPDNDITELIAPHFRERYKSMSFIIHDVKRNKFCLYDGKSVKFITYDKPIFIFPTEVENDVQMLWKQYFNSVNIVSRANKKQQLNYMPKRYHKHALEFEDD